MMVNRVGANSYQMVLAVACDNILECSAIWPIRLVCTTQHKMGTAISLDPPFLTRGYLHKTSTRGFSHVVSTVIVLLLCGISNVLLQV